MNWEKEFAGAVTVCNADGIILYMNDKSCRTFDKDGGKSLIGESLLDCHPEPARSKLIDLLANPRVNAYTIEKSGFKKLIYQAPVYQNGRFDGLVELSLEIPMEMPHFKREPKL